jgi:cell division protein FtsA
MSHYIVGLDIGSHTIKAVVGERKRDDRLTLVRAIKMPALGLRKGVVQDVGEATQSLSPVLAEIKKISKSASGNIFLGIGSSDVSIQSSSGVVAVSRADSEIYQDDINRAIQSAHAVHIPPNRVVLHSIVKEYVVDGVSDIRDPLEMIGSRLEVKSLIIDAFAPSVKNVSKCVEILGGGLGGFILGPLADARAALTKSQKELGVVLINIGFGKTGMCVYEEGKLLHTAIFPVGSGNVTNDLAVGLKVPVAIAETVKLSFGSALAKEISGRDSVDLSKIDAHAEGVISKKFISQIIEIRLAEILEFVNNELAAIGRAKQLPGGAVITGGGAKLPGLVELARQELKLSAQIGIPDSAFLSGANNESVQTVEDPEFACALGLLLTGYDREKETRAASRVFRGMSDALRKIFRYFVP